MGEEDKKEQTSPPEAKKEEKNEEPKLESPVVLFVDLHCEGCAKKIQRSILKIKGVEDVTIVMVKNEVTIKGVVEGQALCNMITQRTKRRARVLSPAEGEPVPEVVASQVAALNTVELTVNMHCQACAEQLKKRILKMKGVRTAETELSLSKVTVTGTMDADRLVDYVYRHTKKQAKIVPQPEPEKPPEEKPKPEEKSKPGVDEKKGEEKEKPAAADGEAPNPEESKDQTEQQGKDGDGGGNDNVAAGQGGEDVLSNKVEEQSMHKMMYYPNYQPFYMIERIPAPQLFSDENPNACCIV